MKDLVAKSTIWRYCAVLLSIALVAGFIVVAIVSPRGNAEEGGGIPYGSMVSRVSSMPGPKVEYTSREASNGRLSGTARLAEGNGSGIRSYCVEAGVGAPPQDSLKVVTWDEYNNFIAQNPRAIERGDGRTETLLGNEENRQKINWIAHNSYPLVDLATLGANAGIAGLKEREAIAATQAAIWHFSDGITDVRFPDVRGFNAPALYEYLTGSANTGRAEDTNATNRTGAFLVGQAWNRGNSGSQRAQDGVIIDETTPVEPEPSEEPTPEPEPSTTEPQPEPSTPEPKPEPKNDFKPTVQTSASVGGAKKFDPKEENTVTDRVHVTGLVEGAHYTLTATLMNQKTEEAINGATGTLSDFTADANTLQEFAKAEDGSVSGYVNVDITLPANSLEPGESAVAFEILTSTEVDATGNPLPEGNSDSVVIGKHEDIDDKAQTVTAKEEPKPAPKKASIELKKYIGSEAFAGEEKPQEKKDDSAVPGAPGVIDAQDPETAYVAKKDQDLTVTFAVKNTGELGLKGVKVSDELITGEGFESSTLSAISPETQDIKVGETAYFTATLKAPAAGKLHGDKAKASGVPVDENGQETEYIPGDSKDGKPVEPGTPVDSNEDPAHAKTLREPSIRTKAEFANGATVVKAGVTVNDTVTYEDLVPGKEYTLSAELMERKGEAKPFEVGNSVGSGSVTFTADESGSGEVVVPITVNDDVTEPAAAVAFETLTSKDEEAQKNRAETLTDGSAPSGDVIADHKDINDEAQTVTSEKPEETPTPTPSTSETPAPTTSETPKPEPKKAGVKLKKYIGAKAENAGSLSVAEAEALNDSQTEATAHEASKAGEDLTVAFVVENTGKLDLKDLKLSDEAIKKAFVNAVDGTEAGVDGDTPQVTNIRPVDESKQKLLKPGEKMVFVGDLKAPAAGKLHADKADVAGTPVDEDGEPTEYTPVDKDGKPKTDEQGKPVVNEPGDSVKSEEDQAHAVTPEDKTPTPTPSTSETPTPTTTPAPTTSETPKPKPQNPELKLKKYINGNDAQDWDTAEFLKPGEKAKVTFKVTNTGDVDLFNVTLSDKTVEGVGDVTNIKPAQIDKLPIGKSDTFTGELVLPEADQKHKDVAKAEGVPENPDEPGTPDEDAPKVPSNEDPAHAKTPPTPSIGTKAELADGATVVKAGVTVKDTVSYENLVPGKRYTLSAELIDKADAKTVLGVGTKTFTPEKASGSVVVDIKVNEDVTEPVEAAVAFETLTSKDEDALKQKASDDVLAGKPQQGGIVLLPKAVTRAAVVAVHHDIEDRAQTVNSEKPEETPTPTPSTSETPKPEPKKTASIALKKYIGAKTELDSVASAEALNDSQTEATAHEASAAGDDLTVALVVENTGDLSLKDIAVPTDEAIAEAFTNELDGTVSGVDGGTPQVTDIKVAEFEGNADKQALLKPGEKVVFVGDLKAPEAGKLHADKAKSEGTPVDEDGNPTSYVPGDKDGKPVVDEHGHPVAKQPGEPVETNEDQAHAKTPEDENPPVKTPDPKLELKKYVGTEAFDPAVGEKEQKSENGQVVAGSEGVLDAQDADKAFLANPGQELTVTFVATNTGNVPLTDVKVTDDLVTTGIGELLSEPAPLNDEEKAKAEKLEPGQSVIFLAQMKPLGAGEKHEDKAKAEGTPPVNPEKPDESVPPVETPEDPAHVKTPEPLEPKIATVATLDGREGKKAKEFDPAEVKDKDLALTDTVTVEGLREGATYTLNAVMMSKATAKEIPGSEATRTFKAEVQDADGITLSRAEDGSITGTVKVPMTLKAGSADLKDGAVAFERMTSTEVDKHGSPLDRSADGSAPAEPASIVEHTDLSDPDQTLVVEEVKGTKPKVAAIELKKYVGDQKFEGKEETQEEKDGTTVPGSAGVLDAQKQPGYIATPEQSLTVTFVVKNTGNLTLKDVTIDDKTIEGLGIKKEDITPAVVSEIKPGEEATFTAPLVAPKSGKIHTDIATATGTPVDEEGNPTNWADKDGNDHNPGDTITSNEDPANASVPESEKPVTSTSPVVTTVTKPGKTVTTTVVTTEPGESTTKTVVTTKPGKPGEPVTETVVTTKPDKPVTKTVVTTEPGKPVVSTVTKPAEPGKPVTSTVVTTEPGRPGVPVTKTVTVTPTEEVKSQKPARPKVSTEAVVEDNAALAKGVRVVDRVSFSGLQPGSKYSLDAELMCKASGQSTGAKNTVVFVPTASAGFVDVPVTITDGACGEQVVFETLKDRDGRIVAVHHDINDVAQTVSKSDGGSPVKAEVARKVAESQKKVTKVVEKTEKTETQVKSGEKSQALVKAPSSSGAVVVSSEGARVVERRGTASSPTASRGVVRSVPAGSLSGENVPAFIE